MSDANESGSNDKCFELSLDLVLDDIQDFAVFRVDEEGRIASWNSGAERLKGYTPEEAIGMHFAELFTDEDRAKGLPDEEMRYAREHGVYKGVGKRRKKGGVHFDAEVTLRSLTTGLLGRGYVKITRDITERVAFEKEARERQKFEETLIGIVSHDLRNPLNAILIAAKSMLRDAPNPPPVERLARLTSSAERAVRLVRDLLDFTRTRSAEGLPIQRAPLELHGAVAQVIDEIRLSHPFREVRLVSPPELRGEFDGDRLAQIVTNLVVNALTYGAQATPVQVTLEDRGEKVRLRVHNAGPAIPEPIRQELFEPLRRGTNEVDRTGSIGLGLYIVRQIARAHGGDVSVRSIDGEGTTFTVELARTDPPPGASGPDTANDAKG